MKKLDFETEVPKRVEKTRNQLKELKLDPKVTTLVQYCDLATKAKVIDPGLAFLSVEELHSFTKKYEEVKQGANELAKSYETRLSSYAKELHELKEELTRTREETKKIKESCERAIVRKEKELRESRERLKIIESEVRELEKRIRGYKTRETKLKTRLLLVTGYDLSEVSKYLKWPQARKKEFPREIPEKVIALAYAVPTRSLEAIREDKIEARDKLYDEVFSGVLSYLREKGIVRDGIDIERLVEFLLLSQEQPIYLAKLRRRPKLVVQTYFDKMGMRVARKEYHNLWIEWIAEKCGGNEDDLCKIFRKLETLGFVSRFGKKTPFYRINKRLGVTGSFLKNWAKQLELIAHFLEERATREDLTFCGKKQCPDCIGYLPNERTEQGCRGYKFWKVGYPVRFPNQPLLKNSEIAKKAAERLRQLAEIIEKI